MRSLALLVILLQGCASLAHAADLKPLVINPATGTYQQIQPGSTLYVPLAYGLASAKPAAAAGITGMVYWATDGQTLYRCNGTSWDALVATTTPSGAASGDLSGTYPSPVVAGLQGGALPSLAAGAFLKRNAGNTAWEVVGYGSAANTVAQGNDARLSDARAPTGAAGGSLAGTYPNPTVAAGVITATEVATANKDGTSATPSMRTLGTGAQQAAAGNDARLSDSRAPTGTASGDLSGTYPSPTVAQINGATLGTTTPTAGNLLIGSGTQWNTKAVTGDITITSNGVATLPATGTAGTYRSVTTDSKGRVTAGTNPTTLAGYGITDAIRNAGGTPSITTGTHAARPAAGTAGRVYLETDTDSVFQDSGAAWVLMLPALTGDATTTAGSTAVALAASGVTAATYGSSTTIPVLTVDAKGRVTSATTAAASIPGGGITGVVGVANGGTGADLSATGGTGQVLRQSASGAAVTVSALGNADLPATGISAGTYRSVTVNTKGVATAGTNPTTVAGYGLTDAVTNAGATPSIAAGLIASRPTAGTAGRLYVATDTGATYRDTGAAWALLVPALSGDVTTSAGALATTLASTGVTAATYGSASSVPVLDIDAKGRATSATEVAIALPATQVTGTLPYAQLGAASKVGARLVAVANTSTSSAASSYDGVTPSAGDRILLVGQTTGAQNGLWVWASAGAALTRPTDYAAGSTLQAFAGVRVPVDAGTLAGTIYRLTTAGAITIGTTSTAWSAVAPGGVASVNARTGAVTLVATDIPDMVASGAGHAGGAVPDPPSSSGTTKFLREDATWAIPPGGGGGSGTVTSVALTLPSIFSVAGSPVTTTGTLAGTLASQSANLVFAGPTSSTAAPTFRALVAGDIPSLPASQITSGQLAVARGGTGLDGSSASNGKLLIGNGSGYSLATLTAGSGVTITNGSGTITIDASGGGGGGVSSVNTRTGAVTLNATDIPTMVASGASHAGGAVPDPGVTAGSAKFLREDATWQLPPGTIGGSIASAQIAVGSGSNTINGFSNLTADTNTVFLDGSGGAPATIKVRSASGQNARFIADAGAGGFALLDFKVGGALQTEFYDNGTTLAIYDGAAGGSAAEYSHSSGQWTFFGGIVAPAATVSHASLRLPHGSAPSSPVNGDIWTTTSGIYVRINGSTVGPLAIAGGALGDVYEGGTTSILDLSQNGVGHLSGIEQGALIATASIDVAATSKAYGIRTGVALPPSATVTRSIGLEVEALTGGLSANTAKGFGVVIGSFSGTGTATNTADLYIGTATTSYTGNYSIYDDAVFPARFNATIIAGSNVAVGVTKTTTAAGTTTLTALSNGMQIFTGSTTQTVVMPPASSFGSGIGGVFTIKNRSSGALTINRAGSDTIDGATSTTIAAGASATFVSDAVSDWTIN